MWTLIIRETAEPSDVEGSVILTFLALFVLACLFGSQSADAQWKKLLQKGGIGTVFFLGDSGLPGVGFAAGSDSVLYRTVDGGKNWSRIEFPLNSAFTTIDISSDFAFRDSMTGWVTIWRPETRKLGIYVTHDAGVSWDPVISPTWDPVAIYYDLASDGLFVSAYGDDAWASRSWDEGTTWEHLVPFDDEISGFAFSSGDSGILAGHWNWYNNHPYWYRTTDGGRNWNRLTIDSSVWDPLAIQGTSTYFALTCFGSVLRTDDAWDTWRVLHTFPWPYSIARHTESMATSGCIRGTLDDLVLQTGLGCYRSTDEGKTWDYLCGPVSLEVNARRFYFRDHYLYCSEEDTGSLGGLWYLDLDSLTPSHQDFDAEFVNGRKQMSVGVGEAVSVGFYPQTDMSQDSIHLTVAFDTNAFTYSSISAPAGWRVDYAHDSDGIVDALIINGGRNPLPSEELKLVFNTILTKLSAEIIVERAQVLSHQFNSECLAQHLAPPDTLAVSFDGCGDSILLHYMQTGAFSLSDMRPSPVDNTVSFTLTDKLLLGIRYGLFDCLGGLRLSGDLSTGECSIGLGSLPNGVYYLRLSEAGYTVTRRVVVEH